MTTINTSSLSTYNSAFTAAIKKPDAAQTDETKTAAPEKITADMSGTQVSEASKSSGGSPKEQMIEQIKKQIEDTQEMLEKLREQLAAVQKGSADDDTKAQQSMAIQSQIIAASANLQTLQASLLELIGGSVDTKA
ncbi:hypothetical protein [Pseudomonas ovata]|uniref:hypothetical protein n=1 Tax=Pseudomonas ovata TaxID=1839709 RepID=UPI000D69017E|nr:hypothetical protein [Pseudomonas ovata]